MNCKPGDLAIMVKSLAGNEGKIVRCVRMLGMVRKYDNYGVVTCVPDVWEIDQQVPSVGQIPTSRVRDAWLRPIRPQPDDAQDETLTWLPAPTQIPETV